MSYDPCYLALLLSSELQDAWLTHPDNGNGSMTVLHSLHEGCDTHIILLTNDDADRKAVYRVTVERAS